MKIAIPSANGKLSLHFGHCKDFDIFEVDEGSKTITKKESHTPPPHEPGVLPAWLSDMNVDLILAGGMGQRAVQMFEDKGIKVLVGVQGEETESLVKSYMEGTIVSGTNVCDH